MSFCDSAVFRELSVKSYNQPTLDVIDEEEVIQGRSQYESKSLIGLILSGIDYLRLVC